MGASYSGPDFRQPAFEPTTADDPAAVSGHRVSARLGTSALGRVYLAHAPGGQPVALTVVHPELAAREGFAVRFHRDAQEAGDVQAPGALPLLGSGQEGGRFWTATAYVPALPLDTAVTGHGPLPTRVVLRLLAGLAQTLQGLHHAGVVHGDLRPAHVLLAADGPKVTGYGLAAVAGPALEGQGPAFLAPEQAAGRPATAATDVFALGQIAAYASIGRPPFDDPARIAQDEPDLNELPGELREIVTRCLIKEPGLRPSLAQVVTMCGQAAPPSPHARPDTWLPPALLAAIVPAMPPPHPAATAGSAAPGNAPAPAPPSPSPAPAGPDGQPAPAPGGPVGPAPPVVAPGGSVGPAPPVVAPGGSVGPAHPVVAPGGPVGPAHPVVAPGGPVGPAHPVVAPGGPVGPAHPAPAHPAAGEEAAADAVAAPGATPPPAVPAAPDGTGTPAHPSAPPVPGGQPPSLPAANSPRGQGSPVPHGAPAPPVPGGQPPSLPAANSPQRQASPVPPGAPAPPVPGGQPPSLPAANSPRGQGSPVPPGAPAPPVPGGQVPSAPGVPVPSAHGAQVPPLPGPGAPPGAGHWGPGALHWPHLPHMPHLPLARPRRRTAGVTAAAVGLILAVGAGVALAGGMGGSGHDDADGKGFGATAPGRSGTAATPSAGAAAPTTPVPRTPVPTTPMSPTPDPTSPAPGTVYQGIRLQAGSSLALLDDPPSVQPDASGGSFGLDERGDAFIAEPHQAGLSLPAQGLPPTLDTCRGDTSADVASIPRQSVGVGGGRICVHMTDGTTALVTVRQFQSPAGRPPSAVIDVTVWHQLDH
ncbi:serine/threonine-protein kinase [Actinacidiphila acidipaludis]|uniref:Protein kinase n=1 Tax=Actinacidiphila acidipaludis TaxID=2873382 RepID=A0ABS7Q588_9ACTN|nr:serine/threonine protein kinase [Streptomyces acidipaludis]MBY8878011.1 protein kinase [Streptomyces acidipaludis]